MTKLSRPCQKGLRILVKNKTYLILLLPAFLYVLIFCYLPMGGLVIAFKQYNYHKGILGSPWVGLANFRFLFISGKLWTLTRNTLLYNIAFIVLGIVMQVFVAITVNETRCVWFKKTFQTFSFLPFFVSWIVVNAIFQNLLDYDNGLIIHVLRSIGITPPNIYTTADPWPFLLVLINLWKSTGYGSIVYLSAITSIPQEIYEAAEIDGANSFAKIRSITLPCLVPTIVIMFLMSCGGIFRGYFGMFYQLIGNNGVLLEKCDIIDLYIYRTMTSSASQGMSTAAGLYQSVLCFATILLANYIVKRIQPDYTLF